MAGALRNAIHGIGWGGLSTGANVSFQLIFMAVMARLLDPSHFGLIAIANVMLRFLSYFAQLGVGPALIQKPELVDGDIRAALSMSLLFSVACTIIAFTAAPLIAGYFEMRTLAHVIQLLSVTFILNGLSAVSSSMLRRNMQFRDLAIMEITAYVMGYGLVGIGMAYYGYGVWALVGAVLSQSLLNTILGYLFSRHEIGLQHTRYQRRHFLGFGTRYSLIGFIEFLSGSLDALIVGKIFGSAAAGIYGRASILANLPVQQPANIISRTMFPIISRLGVQRQLASLEISVLILGCYAFSISLGMFAAAEDIVWVLLGGKWLDAIPVLQILTLAVGVQYLSHLVGVTLDAMGALKLKLRVQTAVLVIQILAFATMARFGVEGVAWVIVLAEWLRFILMAGLVAMLLKPSLLEFRQIFTIVMVTGLSTLCMIWITVEMLPSGLSHWVRLLIEMIVGGASFICVSLLSRSFLRRLPVINELAERMPLLGRFLPSPTFQRP